MINNNLINLEKNWYLNDYLNMNTRKDEILIIKLNEINLSMLFLNWGT